MKFWQALMVTLGLDVIQIALLKAWTGTSVATSTTAVLAGDVVEATVLTKLTQGNNMAFFKRLGVFATKELDIASVGQDSRLLKAELKGAQVRSEVIQEFVKMDKPIPTFDVTLAILRGEIEIEQPAPKRTKPAKPAKAGTTAAAE